ncbi:MAG: hydrogen peroxide-inducible genes activator, partial [Ignavibacteriaceae bacterium]|nr:hydrogen peroxide-inducible genes activator [Ignavibacteriaceae bacterium]
MTLAQFYYIVAVDNFRSFSVAANHCFVTQPTLSMQIQKLEEELGITIFNRSKSPVTPTDIGVKVLRQARIVLHESERLQSIIDDETGHFSGILKIGIIPTVAPYLIPLFLQPFVEKFPHVELTIDEITTSEIVTALNKDVIDVGILSLPLNEHNLVEKGLFYEPFLAYLPKNHHLSEKEYLTTEDISPDELLLLKEGHCFRDQALKICSATKGGLNKHGGRILFDSGNLDTLKKLVEQDFGVTLLPYLAVQSLGVNDEHAILKEFEIPIPKR